MSDISREVPGTTTRLLVEHIRSHVGKRGVQMVLNLAGEQRSINELCDSGSWSSYEQKLALFEAAAEVLDDPQVGRHIGESILRHAVVPGTLLALRVLGSPASVMRILGRTTPRFSSISSMEATEVGSRQAVVRYQLHEGYRAHRMDCDYQVGLLTQVAPLFGLPPAKVVHVECQVDGAEACIYQVRWQPHSFLPWRARGRARRMQLMNLQEQLDAAKEGVDSLRSTVGDLVSEDGIDSVLERVGLRASFALLARGFLLEVRDVLDADVSRYSHGLDDREMESFHELMEGKPRVLPEGCILVDVSSARRSYGRLLIVGSEHERESRGIEEILDAYASYAAIALDIAAALDEARLGRETAEALLYLARDLGEQTCRDDVARRLVTAAQRLVGSDLAIALVWEPGAKLLRVAAMVGFPPEVETQLSGMTFDTDDTPDLAGFIRALRPRRFESANTSTPIPQPSEEGYGAFGGLTWPISARGEFLGVLWVGSSSGQPLKVSVALVSKMAALADEASLALERARLIESDSLMTRQLEFQAYRDSLTGLPNAKLFRERLTTVIEQAKHYGRFEAVVLFNIDHFAAVNSRLGRPVGDQLLIGVGERIRSQVRDGDTVARLGSDEFGIICATREFGDAAIVAKNVLSAIDRPFLIDGEEVNVTLSAGVVVIPNQSDHCEIVIGNADIALRRARRLGGNTHQMYEASMGTLVQERHAMESELRYAIDHDELVLHYQPQIDLANGQLVGAEALVRWQHPRLGLLPPAEFIGIAEESGLIIPLGEWVLRTASLQTVEWQNKGLRPITMAVNVSVRQVQGQEDFVRSTMDVLAETGLDPQYLELEMTESFSAHNLDSIAVALQGLRNNGIRVAIDDFGTGYAFFGYVQRFPISRIKIDQSFIRGIEQANEEGAIVRGMLDMTLTMKLDVVAEGIETQVQADFLRAHGCQQGQGYLFGYPVPPEELEHLLESDEPVMQFD